MSWGYRVVLILVVFVVGIGCMVFIAMRQSNEMVDDNYYEKEMKYQAVIDAKNNLSALNDSVQVSSNDTMVHIRLPLPAAQNVTEGHIEFLRSADKTMDRTIALAVNAAGVQLLPRTHFTKGLYRIRAQWNSGGKKYYDERDVIIQ